MKCITEANASILSILGKPKSSESGYRLMKYCAKAQVDEGVLLCNIATREMVLLDEAEYANLTKLDYLKQHWFLVSEDTNEKESIDTLKWVLDNTQKKSDAITGYTIMTTTDCNARCFYCFELGKPRIPMTEEIAHKTATYIKDHCNGESVKLVWFGGEPLFNMPVIDIICNDLQAYGITYVSTMLSNGYLFDEKAVEKAKNLWNLNSVQITMDGTEEIYNKSKAYIYRNGSPYQIVLDNIGHILDAKIKVTIRLNMDLYNAEDLLSFVDEVAARFEGKSGLNVYAAHLFDANLTLEETHSDEEWDLRFDAMYALETRIAQKNLSSRKRISKKMKTFHCRADSGSSVMILPSGEIGLCGHYAHKDLVGHIDNAELDSDLLAVWKERMPELPECGDCLYYPSCIRLKNCTTHKACFKQLREERFRFIRNCMLDEYKTWKEKSL